MDVETVTTSYPAEHLPVELSSFIGRDNERKQVLELSSSSRLVTLTGTGGIGKTRLAMSVIGDMRADKRARVHFADLAPLSDPDWV